MKITHEIDFGSGFVSVPAPSNFDSTELDIVFTKDKARATIANFTLVWKADTAKKIYNVYQAGKYGGKGIAYALPYRITICGQNLIFNMMLVLGHSSTKLSCDQVECPAWEAQGMDWFEKQTQAYSFWHLYKNLGSTDPGKIDVSDFKKTPYTVTSIPNYTQVISLSFQELILIWQLSELISNFTGEETEIVADTGESAIPIVGTPHIIVTVAHIITSALKVAEIILYITLIFKFAQELQANIIQRKKYKLCMKEVDHFRKMCSFFGLNFSSSIYAPNSQFANATWMPSKIVMPKISQNILDTFNDTLFDRPENEENNPKSTGYFEGTFAEFIDTMERKYNAEAKVINGTLFFEERHYWNVQNPYILPNTSDVGYTFNLPTPFRTNLSELAPYYQVAFQVDDSEMNTIHRYRGTSCAIQIISPFGINKYSGWGQGQIIDLGSALAKRKEYTTKIEDFLDKVLKVVHDIFSVIIAPINLLIDGLNLAITAINALISAWNAIAPNALQIGNSIPAIPHIQNPVPLGVYASRIGWMELSNDSFSVPKTFIGTQIGSDWELDTSSESVMSAYNLLQSYHGQNLATRGNQWIIFENNKTRFCCIDYIQIAGSNVLKTPDGRFGKFDSIKWSLSKEQARDVQYRINEIYLAGLQEKIIIDGTP